MITKAELDEMAAAHEARMRDVAAEDEAARQAAAAPPRPAPKRKAPAYLTVSSAQDLARAVGEHVAEQMAALRKEFAAEIERVNTAHKLALAEMRAEFLMTQLERERAINARADEPGRELTIPSLQMKLQ